MDADPAGQSVPFPTNRPRIASLLKAGLSTHLKSLFKLFKNNQHDVTCGLSFIFMGSRHSLSTCFELSASSSSGDHFPCSQPLV